MAINVVVPDTAICRTRHAYGDFWTCLVDYDEIGYSCAYLVGIERQRFCMHHGCREFEEK